MVTEEEERRAKALEAAARVHQGQGTTALNLAREASILARWLATGTIRD